jgi:hypothetical protein
LSFSELRGGNAVEGSASYRSRLLEVPVDGEFRFKCTRCGACCSGGPNVSLTVFDVVRMAKFLKMHWRDFLRGYVKVIVADVLPFMALRGDEQGRCLLLYERHDGTTECTVYPARPMRCRLYPVLVEDLGGQRVYLDPKSPGVGRGSGRPLPRRLVSQYIGERRRHYQLLYKLVVEEGMDPLEALERAIEEAWRESEECGKECWSDLDYLDSLGEV